LEGVKTNLERKPLSDAELQEQHDTEMLMEKLSSSPSQTTERKVMDAHFEQTIYFNLFLFQRRDSTDSTSAEQIFHDTAGWKSLETWMKYALAYSLTSPVWIIFFSDVFNVPLMGVDRNSTRTLTRVFWNSSFKLSITQTDL
jgi:hypothetical protein